MPWYDKYLLNKIPNMKFDLFMKYKNDLNSRVSLVEDHIDSESMNPVVNRKSSILNLSINDVHFMKYSKLKKITDAIDKEEHHDVTYTVKDKTVSVHW